ncbi:Damm family protein [Megaselia abdita]
MKLLREQHCFSDLNRKYKSGLIRQNEFLEKITNNLEKECNEFKEGVLEFVFLELISIANNKNTKVILVAPFFERIMKILLVKGSFKQNVVRFEKLDNESHPNRYRELYSPVIEALENHVEFGSAPIDQLVYFYWAFDLVLSGVHRKTLPIKLLTIQTDEVIKLLKNDNVCYFVAGIFKSRIDDLDEDVVSKIATELYNIHNKHNEEWIKDYIANVFISIYREKISVPKSLILRMIICVFAKKSGIFTREGLQKDMDGVMHSIGDQSAFKEYNSSKVYSEFVQEVGLNVSSVLIAIKKGLEKELPPQIRVNYIKGFAAIVNDAIVGLTEKDALLATTVYSRHLAHENSAVTEACVDTFPEFATAIPYDGFLLALLRLPKSELSCLHFNRFTKALKICVLNSESSLKFDIADIFLNHLKFGDIVTEGLYNLKSKTLHLDDIYNLIDAMDFTNLRLLILKPLNNFDFLEKKGKILNFSLILKITFERHYTFLMEDHKKFLCRCLLNALKYEIRILDSTSEHILKPCSFLDIDFFEEKFLPILCAAGSTKIFEPEFIKFTSSVYSKLKTHQPLLKNKFMETLDSTDFFINDYSAILNVFETKIIENELLPKMLSFSNECLISFCCKSFSSFFNKLPNHLRNKLKEKLTGIFRDSYYKIEFSMFASMFKNYELQGRDISRRLSNSFEDILTADNKTFPEDTDSNKYLDHCFVAIKDAVLNNFEKHIRNYEYKYHKILTFLWHIIIRNRSKLLEGEYQKLLHKIQDTEFDFEAKRIFQNNLNKEHKSPGVAIVFHNDEWPDIPEMHREGSKKDIDLLKNTFELYSIPTLIVENPTIGDISKVIKKDFIRRIASTQLLVSKDSAIPT